jgi:ribose/xylose/arabinose/galactoside ABC-type transport system permease subunit
MTTIPLDSLEERGRTNWATIVSMLGPLIGLIFVFVLFAILVPLKTGRHIFLTPANYELMLVQTSVVGTAALGMTLIIISGGIDLSVGSNIALVTVAVALVLNKFAPADDPSAVVSGWGTFTAAVAGIATAALVGLAIGLMVTALRLPPFIATLGLWGAVRGVAKGFADERTINAPITGLNKLLESVPADSRWMILPPGVWLMFGLAVGTWAMLRYTRFGRHIFAIGSNEQTARLCGVSVNRTKILIYVVASALAGVAGVLHFAYLGIGDPTTANGMELNIIAAVVIGGGSLAGGEGSVLGSLIGALIMQVLQSGCSQMGWPNWVQEIVTGAIIVVAVALDRFRHRR